MSTANDLWNAVSNFHFSNASYNDVQTIEACIDTLRNRVTAYKFTSQYKEEYEKYLKQEQKKHLKKAQSRASLSKKRYYATMEAIEDGTLHEGVFLKVVGARDGYGYRELVSVDEDRKQLICRQWLPKYVKPTDLRDPDALRRQGWIKFDDKWIAPQTQMTTHEYDKVAKIFG